MTKLRFNLVAITITLSSPTDYSVRLCRKNAICSLAMGKLTKGELAAALCSRLTTAIMVDSPRLVIFRRQHVPLPEFENGKDTIKFY